jgi:hypothetical protein
MRSSFCLAALLALVACSSDSPPARGGGVDDGGSPEASVVDAPGSTEASTIDAPGSTEASTIDAAGPTEASAFDAAGSIEASPPDEAGSVDSSLPEASGVGTADTWASWAQGFFAKYCIECHSARDPQGRNYTVQTNVVRDKLLIRCGVAAAQDPAWGCASFPPAKQFPINDAAGTNLKPSDAERARVVAWITAGAM